MLLSVLLLLAVPVQAQETPAPVLPQADSIISDISKRSIAITVGFTGADTTLFGALPENGDVIVTVTGPSTEVAVRRKERVAGIWLNRASTEFANVPGFYWLASSRPLADIASEQWLAAQRIGASHLRFTISDASDYRQVSEFQRALLELKTAQQHFTIFPAPVPVMGGRLYRADVHIPADAPTGEYIVTTYLLRGGVLLETQKSLFSLRKQGSMAQISGLAQRQAFLYGLFAVSVALLMGWLSAKLIQRS